VSPDAIAEVNGEVITGKQLGEALGTRLSQLEEQIYTLKRRELDALIAQRLLAQEAAKRRVSVEELLDTEITSKVGLVTEKEVEAFYQENKARLRGEGPALRERVRAYLQQRKISARRDAFVESLRAQSKVVVVLAPPPVVRVNVTAANGPFKGPADAPVTLVEFSDFHCPFCRQSQATLKQLRDRYPDKLKLVYRDLPLDQLHPQARAAAEAARCAKDQGKFWEYHDVLFAQPPQATPQILRTYAEQTALDVAAFDRCVASGTHRAAVQRDVEEGERLGLNGTPAFFINGRPLIGAQPLEAFVRIIEEELVRTDDGRTEKR